MKARISVLHATHHREAGPLAVKERWLAAAEQPGFIDYVFAMDGDDVESIRRTEGHNRIVGSIEPRVTAVRNWNNAATLATGELLVVIADDLLPSEGWDTQLRNVIGGLDPLRTAFAVKIRDSDRADGVLLRHPVISRAFYEAHGLFNPKYRGVYCDNDITLRAFWRAAVLDGRSVVFVHEHPFGDDLVQSSVSQTRINTDREYEHGRQVFESEWSERQRAASVRLIQSASLAGRDARLLRVHAARSRMRASLVYVLRLWRNNFRSILPVRV